MKTPLINLALLLSLILTGCSYWVPLEEANTITIDKEVLGVWIAEEDLEKAERAQDGFIILPFSASEYLVVLKHSEGDEHLYLKGYPINVGGIDLVQIEMLILTEYDSENHEDQEKRFHVAKYKIKGDLLSVQLLSEDVVSGNIRTTSELKQVFLKNIDDPDLFEEPTQYKKVSDP